MARPNRRTGWTGLIALAVLGCGGPRVQCPATTKTWRTDRSAWCVDPTTGKRSGPYVELHAGGNVRRQGHYLDDERHGLWTYFWQDGTVLSQGAFDAGDMVGVWRLHSLGSALTSDFGKGPNDTVAPAFRAVLPPEGGGCDKNDIAGVVRAHGTHLRRCYDRELSRRTFSGKLTMRFWVGSGGRVWWVETIDDTAHSENLRQCVEDTLAALKFEPPRLGVCVVQWPFVFSVQ